MDREKIIAMARDAGLMWPVYDTGIGVALDRFAGLVAAAEREACAKACDAIAADKWALYKGRAPYSGHENGRADPGIQGISDGADLCADAIRARSNDAGA